MKILLFIFACMIMSYASSQEFKTKEEFIDSLPAINKKEILVKVEKEWMSQMTEEDLYCIKYAKNKSTKKVNITWNLSYTDYNYLSNYVNGFNISIINNTNKTIKYVNFNVKAFNAVGDMVYDGYKTRKGIGPVEGHETGSWSFDNCWIYDNTIDEVKMLSMSIEYTDKSKLVINDISDVNIDFDITDKYSELTDKKLVMLNIQYDSLYNIEKEKHDLKITEKLEKERAIRDSIQKREDFIKDSIKNVSLKIEYFKLKNSLVENKTELESNVKNLLSLDIEKKEYIKFLFDKNVDKDLIQYQRDLNRLVLIERDIDTTNNLELSKYIDRYKYESINIDIIYKYKIDYNFVSKPLKKTDLYKDNKDEYKDKKRAEIEPIDKHISLMYVYGGGKLPYGFGTQLHLFNNVSIYGEYKTDRGLDNVVDDSPESELSIPSNEFKDFYSIVKEKNIYKYENDWDRSYKNFNIGLLFPLNHKKNLLISLGIGKTFITEYKRYALPYDFYNQEIYGSNNYYTNIYLSKDLINNNNFYLKSNNRSLNNINYNIGLTFIMNVLTFNIAVDIKDTKDIRTNIGIGLTF
jgi:hypothetical protein